MQYIVVSKPSYLTIVNQITLTNALRRTKIALSKGIVLKISKLNIAYQALSVLLSYVKAVGRPDSDILQRFPGQRTRCISTSTT